MNKSFPMDISKIFSKISFFTSVVFISLKRKINLFKNLKYIVVFLVIALVSFGVFQFIKNNQLIKPTLVEGVVGTYREEDLPDLVNNLLSTSLVSLDSTGMPYGNLVENWSVSEDGKTYTFVLKDNLYWTSGEKIKVGDIGIPLQDVEVAAKDDKTLEFKLPEPFSPFPTLLTRPVFKKHDHLGTGPYTVSKVFKDQIFVKKVILDSKDKNLPRVVIKFYPSEKIAKDALKLGEVQALLGVNDKDDLVSQKNLRLEQKTNFSQLVAVFYNIQDPILSDNDLRLALSFSAPSVKDETEAKSTLSEKNWAFNPDIKDYLDNQTQAESYFKKVQNKDKLKEKPIVLTATTSLGKVGQQIVDSWNKMGINSVLRIESGIPQNFQALLIAQNIPSDPDQYSLWHSTQSHTNISRFSNPRVDKDLEDGRKEKDPKVRKEKYQDFQKVLMDQSPATPLFFPKYNMVYMSKVEGLFKQIAPMQLPNLYQ